MVAVLSVAAGGQGRGAESVTTVPGLGISSGGALLTLRCRYEILWQICSTNHVCLRRKRIVPLSDRLTSSRRGSS